MPAAAPVAEEVPVEVLPCDVLPCDVLPGDVLPGDVLVGVAAPVDAPAGVAPLVDVPPAAAPVELVVEAELPGGERLVITRTSLPGPACNVLPGKPITRSPAPVPVTVAVGVCATSILVMPPVAAEGMGVVAADPDMPVAPVAPVEPVAPVAPVEPVIPFVDVVAIALTPAKFAKLPVKTPLMARWFMPISLAIQRNAANPLWRGVAFPRRWQS